MWFLKVSLHFSGTSRPLMKCYIGLAKRPRRYKEFKEAMAARLRSRWFTLMLNWWPYFEKKRNSKHFWVKVAIPGTGSAFWTLRANGANINTSHLLTWPRASIHVRTGTFLAILRSGQLTQYSSVCFFINDGSPRAKQRQHQVSLSLQRRDTREEVEVCDWNFFSLKAIHWTEPKHKKSY